MEGEGGSRWEITYLVRDLELLTLSDELGLGNGSLKALEGLCVEVLQVFYQRKSAWPSLSNSMTSSSADKAYIRISKSLKPPCPK